MPSPTAWRCTSCGYIHRGARPPDVCPVCGAAASEFEPYNEPAPVTPTPAQQWRCLNCNHIHQGPQPQEACPVCGAPPKDFEPLASPTATPAGQGPPIHILIVGAGIAGVSAAQSARHANAQARITLLNREPHLPYYRLNLTRYLAGEIGPDQLPIHDQKWYADNAIDLVSSVEVVALDLAGKKAQLSAGGAEVAFDKLVLTAGAHPFIPPLDGADRQGVTSLRTLDDARQILAAVKPGAKVVCVGGGILGLETAAGLARRGAEVTLLEGFAWLMPRQLDPSTARRLEQRVQDLGIHLRKQARSREIVGDTRVAGVRLEDGSLIEADLVVITTGIRPNSHLARRAGLDVASGIVVDDHLRASHPDVLAAGDVAEHRGVLYGTWAPSQFQGSIAGLNAAGGSTEFGGIPRSNTLKVLGVDLLSIGLFQPGDASYRVIEQSDDRRQVRFVFRDTHLVGAVLMGDASIAAQVKKAIEAPVDFSGLLQAHPGGFDVFEHLKQQ